MSDTTLHDDDPDATAFLEDGTVVRNLTADEYAATWSDGTPCNNVPADELEGNDG